MDDKAVDVRVRVGQNLRRYRQAKGISQETLAHQSGVARAYLGGIERGVCNPTVVLLEQLAGKLDIPAAALLETQAEAVTAAE
jgi:transcriptional regulator with XRE-family HTH domain